MSDNWTEHAALPGGDMPKADYETFFNGLKETYPWMSRTLAGHYGRLYGTRTRKIVGDAKGVEGLGRHFGGHLYEAEVRYLVASEWALTPEDVLKRRTKHYLHLTEAEQAAFADWFAGANLVAAA
jgi:glycerol-3-phosphate dehydrogenase